jgi:hypothetical protein
VQGRLEQVKSTVAAVAGLTFITGAALAIPVASDLGSDSGPVPGPGTIEWRATDIGGGTPPYLSGAPGGSPYYLQYGAPGSGISFNNTPAVGEEDLIFIRGSDGKPGFTPDGSGPLAPVSGQNWGTLGVQSITGTYSIQNADSVTYFSVYFLGSSGAMWMLDLPTSAGEHDFEANLLWGSWFDRLGVGTSGDFLADINTTVTNIGYRISYDAGYAGVAGFSIKDITLDDEILGYIPEPQTYAMLGMALVSLGVTFRRRLNGAVDSLKATLRG